MRFRLVAPAVLTLGLLAACSSGVSGRGTHSTGSSTASGTAPASGRTSAGSGPATPIPSSSPSPPSSTGAASGTAAPAGYQHYVNGRFKFSVDVPAAFRRDTAPVDGDGQGFTAPGGRTKVTTFGANNAQGETPAAALATARQDPQVCGGATSSNVERDAFSCNGERDDTGYYFREIVLSHVEFGLEWTFPLDERSRYDDAVEHSIDTFRPGPNRTN